MIRSFDLDAAVLAWFDRHLRGNADAPAGPVAEYRTNHPRWHAVAGFPPADGARRSITVAGRAATGPFPEDDVGDDALPLLRAPATGLEVTGVPRAIVTVTGAGSGGKLALRLVDREAGVIASFHRYLRGDDRVATGSPVEYRRNKACGVPRPTSRRPAGSRSSACRARRCS